MLCNNCGTQNNNNEKFCINCGYALQNEQPNYNVNQNNNLSQETKNIILPNTKKYAIISILIGAGGIFSAIFIGMSLLISLFLSGLGFSLAAKSMKSYKNLAITGCILNGILLAMGIIIYLLLLFEVIEPM